MLTCARRSQLPSTGITSLALETFEQILDELASDPWTSRTNNTLAQTARVATYWTAPSTKRLYRDLVIWSDAQADRLVGSESFLRYIVRSLRITGIWTEEGQKNAGIVVRNLRPGLVSLQIDSKVLDGMTLTFLGRSSFKTLENLSVSPVPGATRISKIHFRLRHLTTCLHYANGNHLKAIVRAALGGGSCSLVSLEVLANIPPETLSVLYPVAPSLSTIVFSGIIFETPLGRQCTFSLLAEFLALATSLSRLTIIDSHDSNPARIPDNLAILLAAIPSPLKSFTLNIRDSHASVELLRRILDGFHCWMAFAQLSSLELTFSEDRSLRKYGDGPKMQETEEWGDFRRVMEDRDILFVTGVRTINDYYPREALEVEELDLNNLPF